MNKDALLSDCFPEEDYVSSQSDKRLIQQLSKYKEENKKLQYHLNLQSAKESLQHTTMERVKKIQEDFEATYQQLFNESKEREKKIKEQYNQYSLNLQSEYTQKETQYKAKIEDLNKQLFIKSEEIRVLQVSSKESIEKNTNSEMTFKQKEKDYEAVIQAKDMQLIEMEKAAKRISFEATGKIEGQSAERLVTFESRMKNSLTVETAPIHIEGINSDEANIETKKDTIRTINEKSDSLHSLNNSMNKQEECCTKCSEVISTLKKENESLLFTNKKLHLESIVKDKEKLLKRQIKTDVKLINHSNRAETMNSILKTSIEEKSNQLKQSSTLNTIETVKKAFLYKSAPKGKQMNHNERNSIKKRCMTAVSNKTKPAISRNFPVKSSLINTSDSYKKSATSYLNKSSHLTQCEERLKKLNSKIDNLKKSIQHSKQ